MFLPRLHAQDYDFSRLDKMLRDSVDRTGPVAVMFTQHGATIYEGGVGGTVHSRVGTASCSKWLAAATLVALQDRGLLDLDDSVGKYLPSFTGPKAAITIRQCLSHTSGLPSESGYEGDRTLTLAAAVDSIGLNVRLVRAPGTRFCYGGVSFQIAGRIAEVVTGKLWNDVFTEYIGGPCEMVNSGYVGSNPPVAGGCRSSAADYTNFLLMFQAGGTFKGRRVLSESGVREMMTSNTQGIEIDCANESRSADHYGLGLWLAAFNPETGLPSVVSHFGLNGFRTWIDFCRGLTGAFAVYDTPDDSLYSRNTYQSVRDGVERVVPDTCAVAAGVEQRASDREAATAFANVPDVLPNPVAGDAEIRITLNAPTHATVRLFDAGGRDIMLVADGQFEAGSHALPLDASTLPPGVYFVRLEVPGAAALRAVVVGQ